MKDDADHAMFCDCVECLRREVEYQRMLNPHVESGLRDALKRKFAARAREIVNGKR